MTAPDFQALVRQFHETFGHPVATEPTLVDPATAQLRFELIREELDEYLEAAVDNNIVEIADALGDILYVTFGAGLVHGIDLGPVFEEIQRSNMSKLGEDGKPIYREDGKILKGPHYFRPNIAHVLAEQEAA